MSLYGLKSTDFLHVVMLDCLMIMNLVENVLRKYSELWWESKEWKRLPILDKKSKSTT